MARGGHDGGRGVARGGYDGGRVWLGEEVRRRGCGSGRT